MDFAITNAYRNVIEDGKSSICVSMLTSMPSILMYICQLAYVHMLHMTRNTTQPRHANFPPPPLHSDPAL